MRIGKATQGEESTAPGGSEFQLTHDTTRPRHTWIIPEAVNTV